MKHEQLGERRSESLQVTALRATLEETARFSSGGTEITEEMLERDARLRKAAERAGTTLRGQVVELGDAEFSELAKSVTPFERTILHAARGTLTDMEVKRRSLEKQIEEG